MGSSAGGAGNSGNGGQTGGSSSARANGSPMAAGSIAHAILATHPTAGGSVPDPLAVCIESCFACAMSCTACADACLAEESVAMLRDCIRTNLDCADICIATGKVLSRLYQPNNRIREEQLHACLAACMECGDICRQHAEHHEHCRVCADACANCADACQQALDLFARAGG
jgi:hypothetical protein